MPAVDDILRSRERAGAGRDLRRASRQTAAANFFAVKKLRRDAHGQLALREHAKRRRLARRRPPAAPSRAPSAGATAPAWAKVHHIAGQALLPWRAALVGRRARPEAALQLQHFSLATAMKENLEPRGRVRRAGGVDARAALLFVDISGFTNLCTRVTIDRLQYHINEYWEDHQHRLGGRRRRPPLRRRRAPLRVAAATGHCRRRAGAGARGPRGVRDGAAAQQGRELLPDPGGERGALDPQRPRLRRVPLLPRRLGAPLRVLPVGRSGQPDVCGRRQRGARRGGVLGGGVGRPQQPPGPAASTPSPSATAATGCWSRCARRRQRRGLCPRKRRRHRRRWRSRRRRHPPRRRWRGAAPALARALLGELLRLQRQNLAQLALRKDAHEAPLAAYVHETALQVIDEGYADARLVESLAERRSVIVAFAKVGGLADALDEGTGALAALQRVLTTATAAIDAQGGKLANTWSTTRASSSSGRLGRGRGPTRTTPIARSRRRPTSATRCARRATPTRSASRRQCLLRAGGVALPL